MGGLRELHSHGSLNHFYGYFFQVSFGQSFFLFKYLFIYLPCVGSQFQHAGSLLWWDPKCVGSVVAACGLSSYSAWAQCPIAFGVLIPRSGLEPMSPTLEGGFLTTSPPGSPCPIILICLVQRPYLVCLSVLPYVHMPLLAKIDSTEEAYGKFVSLSITPFLTSKKSFCAFVVGEVS